MPRPVTLPHSANRSLAHGLGRAWLVVAAVVVGACSAAPEPSSPPRPVVVEGTPPGSSAAPNEPTARLEPPPVAEGVSAPGLSAVPVVEASTARVLGPATFNPTSLPVADYPPMLLAGNAPATIAPTTQTGLSRQRARVHGGGGKIPSVIEVDNQKLARLQIGTVRLNSGASNRAMLYCADDIARLGRVTVPTPPSPSTTVPVPGLSPASFRAPRQTHQGITPARWEVLERKADGEVVLTITDAWFDNENCTAAVKSVTTIEPKPIVGGLVYGFRGGCIDCQDPDVITFVVPQTRPSSAGGRAYSRGSFSILRMRHRRGSGFGFVGRVAAGSLQRWNETLHPGAATTSKTQQALLSLDLRWDIRTKTHTVTAFGARLD